MRIEKVLSMTGGFCCDMLASQQLHYTLEHYWENFIALLILKRERGAHIVQHLLRGRVLALWIQIC